VTEGLALTSGLTTLAKSSFKRTRPFVYNEQILLEKKLNKKARKSFFSGHTSANAFLFFATAKIISDYSENKAFHAACWTVATSIPAVMGYLRVRSGDHFKSDVTTGYIIGAAFGILIPHLHKVRTEEKLSIVPQVAPNYSGLSISYNLY